MEEFQPKKWLKLYTDIPRYSWDYVPGNYNREYQNWDFYAKNG